MQDRNGAPLAEGDIVLVPFRIITQEDDDTATVRLETVPGLTPSGATEILVLPSALVRLDGDAPTEESEE